LTFLNLQPIVLGGTLLPARSTISGPSAQEIVNNPALRVVCVQVAEMLAEPQPQPPAPSKAPAKE
jgi:hypothetical protein